MAAPTALLTTLLLLAIAFWLGDAGHALIPYQRGLWAAYASFLAAYGSLLALNVSALSFALVRALGLKRTGRKLAHVDQELRSDSAIADELGRLEDPSREE